MVRRTEKKNTFMQSRSGTLARKAGEGGPPKPKVALKQESLILIFEKKMEFDMERKIVC